MAETIRAIFKEGRFEPLDQIKLDEGDEVALSFTRLSERRGGETFREAAGAWKDLVDCDQLIEDVYSSRLIQTRGEPKL